MRNPLLALLKTLHRSVGGHGLGRIPPLRSLYSLFHGLLLPRQVTVQGHVMFLDEKDTLELATRDVYEPPVTELLERYVVPGTLFVDAGANIGYYTLLAARRTGPGGRVVAFEPDATNFRLLKRNVEANGYKNVTLDPRALSDRGGTARLYLNDANRGDHRLFDPGDGRKSVEVATVTLDSALKGMHADRTFVKMDIQGSEENAFRGMRGFLDSCAEAVLVTEFWPDGIRASGGDPGRYLDGIRAAGFRLFEFGEDASQPRPADPAALLARIKPGSDDYVNLLGLKGIGTP